MSSNYLKLNDLGKIYGHYLFLLPKGACFDYLLNGML